MGKGCHWLSELIPVELTLKLIRMGVLKGVLKGETLSFKE